MGKSFSKQAKKQSEKPTSLRLPVTLEAPVMTPNGVIFFLSKPTRGPADHQASKPEVKPASKAASTLAIAAESAMVS